MADQAAELQHILDARDRIIDARREYRDAVAAAREAGATWTQIAETLGITKQAAWERFGKAEGAACFDRLGLDGFDM